jgi:hypothetical protein
MHVFSNKYYGDKINTFLCIKFFHNSIKNPFFYRSLTKILNKIFFVFFNLKHKIYKLNIKSYFNVIKD